MAIKIDMAHYVATTGSSRIAGRWGYWDFRLTKDGKKIGQTNCRASFAGAASWARDKAKEIGADGITLVGWPPEPTN